MVVQGGSDHARHCPLSIPAGAEVPVDCEPRTFEREGATRGRLGRAFGDCNVGVPALCEDDAAV